MRYEYADDLQFVAEEISNLLFPHVDMSRVKCFRSFGSSSKGTIARCHTVGKIMQMAIGVDAHYALEFLELFEKQSDEEKIKTIIHELMHIPKAFGGGFRHHDWVCDKNVNLMYKTYQAKKISKARFEKDNLQRNNEEKIEEKRERNFGINRWF